MDASPAHASSHGRWLPAKAAILAFAVFAIYWPSLDGQWLWDDVSEVTRNATLRTLDGLFRIWFQPPGPDYFPLKSTVQWLEFHAWGLAPAGYHVVSVLLHLASACLLWRLLNQLGLRFGWLAALLFAVHPLCVESVAWVAEQKNTVSLPLLLGSLIWFVDAEATGRRRAWIASWALFTLSLLAKTSGVGLPVALLVWRAWRPPKGKRRSLVPFFASSVVLGLVTVFFQASRAIAGTVVDAHALPERLLLAARAVFFYARMSVLPVALRPAYPAWSQPSLLWDLTLWGLIALIVGLAWRRRETGALLVVIAFGALVAPVTGIVPMSWARIGPVSDHFGYLPMIPLLVFGVVLVGTLALRAHRRAPALAAVIYGLVAVGFGIYSRGLASTYATPVKFWTSAVERNRASYVAAYNYGNALRTEGRNAEAERAYRAACEENPRFAMGFSNLGDVEMAQGKTAEAVGAYRLAVAIDPSLLPSFLKLAHAEATAGHPELAAAAARSAVALDPQSAEAHHALGFALVQTGDLETAAPELEAAARLDPTDGTALTTLGMARAQQGRLPEAIHLCEAALRLDPANARFHNNLGNCFLAAGLTGQAVRAYERALELDSHLAEARQNLELARAREANR